MNRQFDEINENQININKNQVNLQSSLNNSVNIYNSDILDKFKKRPFSAANYQLFPY